MRALTKLAVLSGSGLAATLGVSLLLSGRIGVIGSGATELSLFLTLQVLAVTAAKLGIDQYAFAIVSVDPKRGIRRSRPVLAAGTVVCIGFGVWGWATQGIIFGAGLLVSSILDASSLIRSAQLNGRGEVNRVAIANLASYPLFFVLVVATASLIGFTLPTAIVLLAFCSALRFVICWSGDRGADEIDEIKLKVVIGLAVFGVGNIVIHRADQIGLALQGREVGWAASAVLLRDYLLLARFGEMISGCWPLVGVILFPMLRSMFALRQRLRGLSLLFATPLGVSVAVGFFYFFVWTDRVALARSEGLAFLLAGIVSFYVNFLAYLMLARRRILPLVTVSLFVGLAACLGWLMFRGDASMLKWLVPACLSAFAVACGAWLTLSVADPARR